MKDITIDSYLDICYQMTDEWVKGIESGTVIANKWIKLAIKRYRKDLLRDDLEFRNDEVSRVLKFFYFCKININNKYSRFIPTPWQLFAICQLYGWWYKGTDKRRYRYGYILISRKNGKSTWAILMMLYSLLGDNITAPCSLIVGNSREQAGIDLAYATGVIYNSPALKKRLFPQRYTIKFKDHTNMGYAKILASNSNKQDGYNNSWSLVEECHEMMDHSLFNVLKSGTLSRTNPFTLICTTAGFSLNSLAYDLFLNAQYTLNEEIPNDNFFFLIFGLDEGDNYEDTSLWIKSNPSLNYTLFLEDLVKEWNQAKNLPSEKANFLTKNLNLFLDQSKSWVPKDKIKECTQNLNLDDFKGEKCWAGIDLSSTRDLTALTLLFNRDNKFYMFPIYFFANNVEKVVRKGGINLKYWLDAGYIHQCATNTIDYGMLFDVFKELSGKFIIEKVCYDKFNSALLIPKLQEIGIYCEVFAQNATSFNFPIKYMEKLIYDKEITFQQNPVLLWNFMNVVTYMDGNGNVKFLKNKSLDSIDGAVSGAMAVGAWLSMRQYDFANTP